VLRRGLAGVDLSSNDYLGIARKLAERDVLTRVVQSLGDETLGATGSRLITGNLEAHEELEAFLAAYHNGESALLFGSGYEANLGVLSAVAGRTDTIVYDELIHASMRDGIRLSPARSFGFRHNDLDDLRSKIKSARGECFIAVESLYSMDGDRAPLIQLSELAEEMGAYLIVDEAHATGVYGPKGAGCVAEDDLCERVLARVHTFGKALGYRGACVIGSPALREHLINSSRSFMYTTAPDLLSVRCVREAYAILAESDSERQQLHSLITDVKKLQDGYPELSFLPSESPIQGVLASGNAAALAAERALSSAGFAARAIRAPTVPSGLERVRLCLHSFNSLDQIRAAFDVLRQSMVPTPSRVGGLDG
jgi:8-amino-7-oxononanoate synthase